MEKKPSKIRSRLALCLLAGALAGILLVNQAHGQPSDDRRGAKTLFSSEKLARIRQAMGVQKRHTKRLMNLAGVRAAGTSLSADGQPVIKVFVTSTSAAVIPANLEGIPVHVQVTEPFYAYAEPAPSDRWPRPVPIGVSTGHPDVTAGTIGARVTDGVAVYALSNNHVYANLNNAGIDDEVLQPGSFDGGTLAEDVIGTLADYEPIQFCQIYWIWLFCPRPNTIDAALAEVTATSGGPDLQTATPSDGYGSPSTVIHAAYGDPAIIGDSAEDLAQLLELNVQKYGRTTALTVGTIDAINATVNVCYNQACSKVAQFVDQIIITPGNFSAGGDSGSLIVTHDEAKQPVALLFAGSSTQTIANRIDRVLTTFNVRIDSEANPQLDSLLVTPDLATIDVGQTLQYKAVGTYKDSSTADLTASVTWQSDNPDTATINDQGLATAVSPGTTLISADMEGIMSNEATLQVVPVLSGGPYLQTGKVSASTRYWTTVNLEHDYGEKMVVVCTPNYDKQPHGDAKMPVVAHVRNARGTKFEVKLAQAVGYAVEISQAQIHWMAVEAGVYNLAENGVKMEAVKFESALTDRSGSWVGTKMTYFQQYVSPVVVGQVMSLKSYDALLGFDLWSVFWCRGTSVGSPPSATSLRVGKQTGEDPRPRGSETIGYIVIESGSGNIGSTDYTAALGADTIEGVGQSPPYTYPIELLSDPVSAVAILTQAAMDGANGSWAILYGDNPITADALALAVDEDQAWDKERQHVSEQVGYILFEPR